MRTDELKKEFPQNEIIVDKYGKPSVMVYDYHSVSLYANNGEAERIAFRGGRYSQGLNTGVFKTCLDDPRSYSGDAVGFRSAYYKI